MKQNATFIFKNKPYNDYKELATAFADNWNEAIAQINNDYEVFLNYFLKNDPFVYGQMKIEIKRCKYLDNVLTSLIHFLSPELGICIKGKFFKDLKDMAMYMEQQYSLIVPGIKAFLEDKCISHLYLKDLIKLEKDYDGFVRQLPLLEANGNSDFVYYYFFMHFSKNSMYKSLDLFLGQCLNEKDPIKMFYGITRRSDFLYSLSMVVGLEKTIAYEKNKDFLYSLYDLVHKDIDFDFKKVFYSGYPFFNLANFKNYSYNSPKAKKISEQYVKYSLSYAKGKDTSIDFAKKVFNLYYSFVKEYQNQNIVELNSKFNMNRICCNTICCEAYDALALSAPVSIKEVLHKPIAPNTNENVSDEMFSVPAPDFAHAEEDQGEIKELKKPILADDFNDEDNEPAKISNEVDESTSKLNEFRRHYFSKELVALFSFIFFIWGAFEFIYRVIIKKGIIIEKTFDFGIAGCSIVLAAVSLVIFIKNKKSKALCKKYFDVNGNKNSAYEALNKLERQKIRKNIYYGFRVWSTLMIILSSYILVCLLWFYANPLLTHMTNDLVVKLLLKWNNYLLLIAPVISFLMCILKKKQNLLYAIICYLIEIVVILVVCYILSVF